MRARGLIGVTAALVALSAAGAAAGAVSPGRLASAVVSAMRAQRSYHYVSRQVGPSSGGVRVTMVGDASRTEGIQRITFSRGSRTGHVTVLVVAGTAYVRGDAFTLVNYMGFPAGTARTYAQKWVSLAHTAPGFSTIAADVRLDSSALAELKLPPPVRAGGSTVRHGQHVVGLRATLHHGSVTGIETLYVRATGAPLPVEQTITRSGKIVADVVFGGWGERVHVAAPRGAVPLR